MQCSICKANIYILICSSKRRIKVSVCILFSQTTPADSQDPTTPYPYNHILCFLSLLHINKYNHNNYFTILNACHIHELIIHLTQARQRFVKLR